MRKGQWLSIRVLLFTLLVQVSASALDDPPPPQIALQFDGSPSNYVEIPTSQDFSVSDGGLTVAVWVRPDTFQFANTEPQGGDPQCQYVHWLGKGEDHQQEWAFRMYRDDAIACSGSPSNRSKRISFYVFAPEGGRGCGSYFQDDLLPQFWIHVVGVVDPSTQTVAIYKNGHLRHSDSYATLGLVGGQANLRLATRDAVNSFFQGGLAQLQIWNVALNEPQVSNLYYLGMVPDGLVAQYSLDEGSDSTTVSDSVAGHDDGTIVGGMWDSGVYPIDTSPARQSGGGC
jgi:hypothetical protein